jgi:light-harvesting complex 1 beta chain
MSDSDDRFGMSTYLTPEEAKEFHKLFMATFMGFTGIAVVAHLLVWAWRPWFG